MHLSECCGAPFPEPGYPDTDLCGQCYEHTGAYEEINMHDTVLCDGCNGPYGDNKKGGVIIGSSAYCGECADKYGYADENYEYADEIDEIMDLNKSFKDNVLEYRKRITGSSDGIMRIVAM